MAEFIKKIKCGDKTYNISGSGKNVYFSSSNKTGGTSLKGVKLYNNELRLNSTNKIPTDLQLCEQIQTSKKSGCCFITTVVCDTLNKPDDCDELSQLRRFRDEVMLARPDWQVLVEHYYLVAPALAEQLSQHKDKTEMCLDLYQNYLRPSLAAINQNQHLQAIQIYQAMVEHCWEIVNTDFVEG